MIDRPAVLAGRDAELATLHRALEAARSGTPQVVVIEAEAGMGKSTLAEAFLADAAGIGEALWLRCDEFEQHVAYGAAGILLDDPWLSTSSDVEVGRAILDRLGRARTTAGQVTALAIDDAQWMDRPSAWAVRFALRRLRSDPVLSIIVVRPGSADFGEHLTTEPAATHLVRPGPLTAAAVRQLAASLRSWSVPPGAIDRLVSRTGGVPLLVNAVLVGASDPTQLESDAHLPPSTAAAASHLLAAVDPPTRRLVEACAVLAEPSDLLVVGEMSEVDEPAAAVSIAARAGLLRVTPSGAVHCAHALLREAIYADLSPSRRRQFHARAAQATTGNRRLAHLVYAADRPDPVLTEQLISAAETARSSLQYGIAATHRLQARSIAADPAARENLLLRALIECVEALELDRAAALGPAAEESAPTALRNLALGLLARETGRIGEAKTLLRTALTMAKASGETTLRQRAALEAAILYVRIDEAEAAVAVLQDAENAQDPELGGDAATTRGIALWQSGDVRAALASLHDVPRTPDGASWEADLLAVRGMVHWHAGHLEEALRDLDAAIGLIHLWRPSTNQSRIHVLRSATRYSLGDWDGAAIDAAAACALAEAGAQTWSAALAHALSVDVPAARGQWQAAAEHLALAKAGLADIPSVQVRLTVAHHETKLALARRDWDRVVAICAPLGTADFMRSVSWTRAERWIMPAWIQACLALGQPSTARAALEVYEGAIADRPDGPSPSRLGWLRGLLAESDGEPRTARELYADDLDDPMTGLVPFVRAELLHTMGCLEHALGNRHDAISHLARARDEFARLRAAPQLERCTAELVACGLRSPAPNPLVLSEREEDVAALVARGYTNKEVGVALYLTPKGVEYHLRNIYAKLGIKRRQQLRQLRG
ncbi:helix-turn-helix transcriptional regulator [Microlunatus ginsengisoli]|uniref:helix-turn-helix transcriptional regulator n=1 Tax=Microlunatus ginsengisoli TaxID=363863 RepID=UPI0031D50542